MNEQEEDIDGLLYVTSRELRLLHMDERASDILSSINKHGNCIFTTCGKEYKLKVSIEPFEDDGDDITVFMAGDV